MSANSIMEDANRYVRISQVALCARVVQVTRLISSMQLPVQTWMNVPSEMEAVNKCVSIFLEVPDVNAGQVTRSCQMESPAEI